VTRLVHLLGGEEGRLLLGAVRAHQSGELRGDALLGHHQGRERPQDEVAVILRHLLPLTGVALEVDVERAPLLLLPVPVQRLRVVEVDVGRHAPCMVYIY
jgi:alkanesulfonate monooxygenase SsuD/methylene tetrahydromethanopterin reductase-like flavin-dependent oxidoreductase (luciferase family)